MWQFTVQTERMIDIEKVFLRDMPTDINAYGTYKITSDDSLFNYDILDNTYLIYDEEFMEEDDITYTMFRPYTTGQYVRTILLPYILFIYSSETYHEEYLINLGEWGTIGKHKINKYINLKYQSCITGYDIYELKQKCKYKMIED